MAILDNITQILRQSLLPQTCEQLCAIAGEVALMSGTMAGEVALMSGTIAGEVALMSGTMADVGQSRKSRKPIIALAPRR